MILSNHFILCCLLSFCRQSFPSSGFFFFPNASALHIMWPNYQSIRFSIGASNEYSGWISFIIDWLDLLAVQGTLKSSPAPQFKSVNSLMLNLLCGPTLLSVHDYWKNQSFDYVDLSWQRDISVFCNMLYKSVIAFLKGASAF